MKVVAVSGGFDPLHVGHVRLFKAARALGDKLVIINNNDHWLVKKKGFAFMSQEDRKEIMEALECVDRVITSNHPPNPDDMSIGDELEKLAPDIFANGGDRKPESVDIPVREYEVMRKLGGELVFNVGGEKMRSSSELTEKAKNAEK